MKKIVGAVCALVLLVGVFFVIWNLTRPEVNEGEKTISVEVLHKDASTRSFEIRTDQEYLEGALLDEKIIEGSSSEYGLFITTADGEEADASKEEWWCLTKGGEQMTTGVSTTVISDGDKYEISFTQGYE